MQSTKNNSSFNNSPPAFWEAVFDQLPVGMVLLNENLRLLEYNALVAGLLELNETDHGTSILQLLRFFEAADLRAELNEEIAKNTASGQPVTGTYRLQTRSGKIQLVNLRISPFSFDKKTAFLAFFQEMGPADPEGKKAQDPHAEKSRQSFLMNDQDTLTGEKNQLLDEAHRRLQNHLDNTPLGIIEWRNHVVTVWSKRAEEIFGWTASEAIGKTVEELRLIYENDPKILELKEKVVFGDTQFEQTINQNRTKYNATVYCEWYSFIIRDSQGAVCSIIAFVQDVTQRLQTEKSLYLHEQHLSTIYETITDVLFLLEIEPGPRYRFSSVNQSFLQATGLDKEQVLGRYVQEVIPSPSLDEVLVHYRTAIEQNKTVSWEEKTPYPAWVKTGIVTVTPVFSVEGACRYLVGSVHDITERVAAEAEYKKMYALVQSSPNLICIINPDEKRTFSFLNEAGRKLIGFEGDDLKELNAFQATTEKERNRLRQIAQDKKGFFTEETEIIHQQTGEKIPVLLNSFQIRNEQEETAVAGIATDLREIRKAQSDLKQANAQLRQLAGHLEDVREEERIGIAREIHDELGQLLTAIKLDLFWSRKNIGNDPAQALQKLDDSMAMIDTTIDSIRRIVSDLRPNFLKDLGLAEALRWHIQQFQAKTGIAVSFTCNGAEKAIDEKTALALFRVCQEALTNVQRHAAAKQVKIELEMNDAVLELRITDDGIGFDPGLETGRDSFGLLGMKERATLCGGEISIRSAPGKGTAISIQIPTANHEQG